MDGGPAAKEKKTKPCSGRAREEGNGKTPHLTPKVPPPTLIV